MVAFGQLDKEPSKPHFTAHLFMLTKNRKYPGSTLLNPYEKIHLEQKASNAVMQFFFYFQRHFSVLLFFLL